MTNTLFPLTLANLETTLFEKSGSVGSSPVHHVEAVENGSFKAIGSLMVITVLQDGPPPSFLGEWVYKYLCNPNDWNNLVSVDDIPDQDIASLVQTVSPSHLFSIRWG